jgi:hypothetical protein
MNGNVRDCRKQLALVDGASLQHAAKGHNVSAIDASVLRMLLRRKVPGNGEFIRNPIITMLPCYANSATGAGFERKGFEVIPTESAGEADDIVLRELAEEADPRSIGQIVMVSTDHGYINVLKDKLEQGIRVCWFIADSTDRFGKASIGEELKDMFKKKVFSFVDMAPFMPQLQYPAVPAPARHHGRPITAQHWVGSAK